MPSSSNQFNIEPVSLNSSKSRNSIRMLLVDEQADNIDNERYLSAQRDNNSSFLARDYSQAVLPSLPPPPPPPHNNRINTLPTPPISMVSTPSSSSESEPRERNAQSSSNPTSDVDVNYGNSAAPRTPPPPRCRLPFDQRKPKRRHRTSANQLSILETNFLFCARPPFWVREQISQQVGMSEKAVNIWFQNRRQACRKNQIRIQARPECLLEVPSWTRCKCHSTESRPLTPQLPQLPPYPYLPQMPPLPMSRLPPPPPPQLPLSQPPLSQPQPFVPLYRSRLK